MAPGTGMRSDWSMMRLARELAGFLRPVRVLVALACGLAVIAPAISAAALWWMKLVVDQVLVSRHFAEFAGLAGIYVAIAGAKIALGYGETRLEAAVDERIIRDIRSR